MAPEQITDREASARADVFALGHLAAFALLGHSPFGTGDPIALAHRIAHESPDLGALPPTLRPVIERCLARDPEQRPTLAKVIHFCRIVASVPAHVPGPASAAALAPAPAPAPQPMPTAFAASERPQPQPLPTQTYAPSQPPPAPHPAPGRRIARGPRWPFGTLGTALLSAGAVVALVVGVVLAGRSPAATGRGLHPVAQPSVQHSATTKPSKRPAIASPSPAPAIDPCLIGSWTGVSDDLVNHIDSNPVTFISKGPNTTFQADGTSTVDYGSGTTYAATYQGHAWKEVFKGSATMHTMTRGGLLYISNVSANGSWALSEDGSTQNSGALSVNQTPGPYSCSATTLVEYTPDGSDTETFSRNK